MELNYNKRFNIATMTPFVMATTMLGGCSDVVAEEKRPNLLIIQTDEQSFRTLGCYRDLLPEDQAYVWGKDAKVETPNIDRIAKEGMTCTSYYSSSPVSTPSRASFQTGLYPVATGAPINGMTMDANLVTFAEVLRREGYQTDMVGKWHLAGTPHLDKLYISPGYDFGYMDRSYVFETNHSKWYKIVGKPNEIVASNKRPKVVDPSMYSTDFLTDRCLETLDRDIKKDAPFCMYLSIPDPHSPNIGRDPYTTQFADMKIEKPKTMDSVLVANRPGWAVGGKNEAQKFNPKQVREYFAMIKCIDDNIGRVLDYLDKNNLSDNTIVVFTSDHGDMMYEHHKMDKGNPYEGAAKIPFVIRYPNKIKAGKINRTSYTTCDFAPTILGLMGANQIEGAHGVNDASTYLNNESEVKSDRIVYMTDSPFNSWTAAIDGRYKLVLSCRDTPWLFDLEKDPSELVNYYSDPAYKEVAERLQKELIRQMKQYNEPALDLGIKYLYNSDDKIEYVSPYDGKTLKEIVKLEKETLDKAIIEMHKKCLNKF
ncbi:MAG: sulfatase-like hydrolase/transferase [Rikenellaceae bacterium]